jgi:hypothetical protein
MHSSFTDIGQFRDVIKAVKQSAQFVRIDENGDVIVDRFAPMPVIRFHGSIKTHGTNSGLAMDKDDNIWFQSREHVITIEKDNAGFAFFAESKKDIFKKFLLDIREKNGFKDETIIIFGEWCGGNIQKGVAINGLPKMFIIFAVKIVNGDSENYYLTYDKISEYKSPENNIYNIHDFQTFEIDIDFSKPEEAQNKLVEITNAVEAECPVGKAFGQTGVGEGVVYEGYYKGCRYIFKVKGTKHSSSRVKKLAEVDVEKIASIKEFASYVVTENRLNQAIEQVFTCNSIEPDKKYTGDFLKWIANDVAKEEMDTLIENGFEPNDVMPHIKEHARKWFFAELDKKIGL